MATVNTTGTPNPLIKRGHPARSRVTVLKQVDRAIAEATSLRVLKGWIAQAIERETALDKKRGK